MHGSCILDAFAANCDALVRLWNCFSMSGSPRFIQLRAAVRVRGLFLLQKDRWLNALKCTIPCVASQSFVCLCHNTFDTANCLTRRIHRPAPLHTAKGRVATLSCVRDRHTPHASAVRSLCVPMLYRESCYREMSHVACICVLK